jgi:uncharacterized protein YxjI
MAQEAIRSWTRYQLRRRLFSIGEDFWIENELGERVYRVDGKVLSIHGRFVLEDRGGGELATIETKLLALRPTMRIERGGHLYATVKKALLTLVHPHYTIEVEGGRTLEAEGSITEHEYEIRSNGQVVAMISRRWFSVHDVYGVAVSPGQDDVLLLAAAVCIDELSERGHER